MGTFAQVHTILTGEASDSGQLLLLGHRRIRRTELVRAAALARLLARGARVARSLCVRVARLRAQPCSTDYDDFRPAHTPPTTTRSHTAPAPPSA